MSSTQFLELVVSLTVQVAIVIIVSHWLGRLVDSERVQSRLWTVCYGILLMLILVSVLLPHPRFFSPWQQMSSDHASTLVSFEMQLGNVLFWIWLGGTILSLAVFLLRAFQVNRFLKSCQPVEITDYVSQETLEELFRRLNLTGKQQVRFLTTDRLSTPFCSQLHYPYIVIPEFLLSFETQKFNFVIRHELEHLQTGHPLQLFLQRLVEVIFWFHPMVWWASQQSALCREFACDEAAIQTPQEIAQYLRTLLTIIEYGATQADETPTPLAFGRGQSIIASRARRLTQIARNHSARKKISISGGTAAFSLALATLLIALIWLPVDVLASPRASWSPWPTWSADALHDFGVSVHDFEAYNGRMELHELLKQNSTRQIASPDSLR
ncbi:M56 family metallopeptidase [Gimesia panareensis]|uniref:Regulatory protein BlaR1 n=1 Tax=Gimesia panareensis TaxID=2527978 RepID=A0A518AB12_9PLAN|nr:M56 family metallopeptidase [Gimesia panareensis]QDT29013.1 Regulatory protein BlaR1 [Gimesia panareensis]QDU51865.1 Regulatory protein BlaR1 [Gimesia panareensis]